MKIIDRYVIWSFVKNYVISMMVLIGMYVVLDMVFNFNNLVEFQSDPGASAIQNVFAMLADIVSYYSYQCLLFFVQLSGIIPVVAAAFTLMRLSRFNELTALLAAGVPLLRIAAPIIIVALVLNALLLVDQELVIPQLIPELTRDHNEVHKAARAYFSVQAMQDANGGLMYGARYFPAPDGPDSAPLLTDMDVIERVAVQRVVGGGADAARKPISVMMPLAHVYAAAARWNPDTQSWDLTDGHRRPLTDPAKGVATAATATTLTDDTPRGDGFVREEPPGSFVGYSLTITRGAGTGQTATVTAYDPATRTFTFAPAFATLPDSTSGYALQPVELPCDVYRSNITPEEIALYRSGNFVEFLSTKRIDQLLERPKSYGKLELLRVKHWRFTQPLMNVILLLLAIPTVLTREPGRLKAAATKCLVLTGLGMGAVFLSHQLAGNPPLAFQLSPRGPDHWAALMAWMPLFLFGPVSVFLLDRVKS